jgi:hypothetical protein
LISRQNRDGSVAAWAHAVDIDGARAHYHKVGTELYYVLDGEGSVFLDGVKHGVFQRFYRSQNLLPYTPLPGPDGLIHYSLNTQADTSDYLMRGDSVDPRQHSVNAHGHYRTDHNCNSRIYVRGQIQSHLRYASDRGEVGNRTMPFPKTIAGSALITIAENSKCPASAAYSVREKA